MTNNRLKIENLDNLQDLTSDQLQVIEGGMTVAEAAPVELEAEARIAHPFPTKPIPLPYPRPYPIPCYPGGGRPHPKLISRKCICTPYPTKDSKLPWCAVIL